MEEKLNYRLLFPQHPKAVNKILGQLPDFCKYPLALAQIARQYDFKNATLLRQQCLIDTFYIELVQLDSKDPFEIKYYMGQPRLLLFFMLNGDFDFLNEDCECITKARSETFHLSFLQNGYYQVHSHQGGYLALVVSIDIDWALASTQSYPHLHGLLQLLVQTSQPYGYTPHCPIDNKVKLWLSQLYHLFSRNTTLVEAMLKIKVLEAFDYYERLLIQTGILNLYKIKDRIDRSFTSPVKLQTLAEEAHMHISTLNRRFKKEFGMSPYSYVISLRLQLAYKLIHEQGLDYSEVWILVGYKDPSTFHKAYTKRYTT